MQQTIQPRILVLIVTCQFVDLRIFPPLHFSSASLWEENGSHTMGSPHQNKKKHLMLESEVRGKKKDTGQYDTTRNFVYQVIFQVS